MQTKLLLIYTGGTIGMAKDYRTNSLISFDFENILQKIPELSLIDADIEIESFPTPLDSSDFKPSHWIQLLEIIQRNYKKYQGFVILHGTDTMAYTASALSFMMQNLQKPIIFTGSQLPIGDLRTDAKENLITSLHFASLQNNGIPVVQEICIYFEYKLYRANRTTKINAEHFDAFASPNYPILGESGVHLDIKSEYLWKKTSDSLKIIKDLETNVGLMKIFPGMKQQFIESFFEYNQMFALVIEAFGAGNIFTDSWFLKLIQEKIEKGMKIIIKTQCSGGMVELGRYETSKALQDFGAISGKDLTTEAAITKAICLLPKRLSYKDFKTEYGRNWVGEITIS